MKSKVLIDRDTLERLTDPVTSSFGDVHMAKTIVDYDKILHREMGLTEFIRKHGHAPFDPDTGDALPAAPLSPDHSGGGAGVVLPSRCEIPKPQSNLSDMSMFDYDEGWNACLDKVKELNQ